jgi:hypothetical protein
MKKPGRSRAGLFIGLQAVPNDQWLVDFFSPCLLLRLLLAPPLLACPFSLLAGPCMARAPEALLPEEEDDDFELRVAM